MRTTIPILYLLAFLLACQSPSDKSSTTDSTPTVKNDSIFRAAHFNERVVYSRAFNAITWGMSAVNFELLYEGLVKAKGDFNQVAYWSGRINSKNQTLIPDRNCW